jgi:glycosyltransferase involved in cell wall biosynthesis
LGLDPAAIYLLAGADCGEERRKGFHLLREAVRLSMAEPVFRQAVTEQRVRFLFFGQTSLEDLGFPAQSLGRVDSEVALAKVYAASDAFLLPSTEDNLPNTMLESLCSGTPVIGFAIGGLPEAVESGRNGLLVAGVDAGLLGRAIEDFAGSAELRAKLAAGCTEELRSRFAMEEQARRHRELYEELLRAKPTVAPREPAEAALPMMPFGRAFDAYYPALLRRAKSERLKRRWPFLHRLATLFKSN